MFLYLIRHADAGDADPTQWADDRQRPLSEDGAKKFRQAAKKLSRLVPSVDVDVVLSSSLVLAWHTENFRRGCGLGRAETVRGVRGRWRRGRDQSLEAVYETRAHCPRGSRADDERTGFVVDRR